MGFITITSLLYWIFVINLGLGLANLLPLGPLDGGRMLLTGLTTMFSKRKNTRTSKSRRDRQALKAWSLISWITVALLLITILLPIIRNVGLKI